MNICNPNFFTEPKTLKAGDYTIVVSPMWGCNMETSDDNPEEYKKFLVSIFYPCGAKFGKLTDV